MQKSRLEVAKANAAAIERKQQAKLAGRKEIEDMLLYQAMKDAELQKREVRTTSGRRAGTGVHGSACTNVLTFPSLICDFPCLA